MMYKKNLVWSLLLTCCLVACDSLKADKPVDNSLSETKNEKKKNKKGKKNSEPAATEVKVINQWDLPNILTEISGIAYLGDNRFACVQDESGVIFIYNTSNSRIEKQITFGVANDYEGLAVVGKEAYVVQSDGKIYEISDIGVSSPNVKTYTTSLTADNNIEGLTYDQKNKRLLLAMKGAETGNKNYKGIYAFDLNTKKLNPNPVYKIDLTNQHFQSNAGKKLSSALQPSDIAVNPTNDLIYILEGTNPQLVIMDSQSNIQTRYKLDKAVFKQPEGITFSPKGNLFISNEGGKGKGNIQEVQVE